MRARFRSGDGKFVNAIAFRVEKTRVKPRVMRHQDAARNKSKQIVRNLSKSRRVQDVAVGNAVDACWTNVALWVNQSRPCADLVTSWVEANDAKFNYPVRSWMKSGGFNIDNRPGPCVCLSSQRVHAKLPRPPEASV